MTEQFMKEMEETRKRIQEVADITDEQALSILSIAEAFFMKFIEVYSLLASGRPDND